MWWMVVVRWVSFPTVLVLYGLLIYSTVCGQLGLLHLLQLTQEQREWETQVRSLLRNNADLKDRIQRLHTDDEFLEKVVREGLGSRARRPFASGRSGLLRWKRVWTG